MGKLISVPINKWYEKRDREQFEMAQAEILLRRARDAFDKGQLDKRLYDEAVELVCSSYGLVNLGTPA